MFSKNNLPVVSPIISKLHCEKAKSHTRNFPQNANHNDTGNSHQFASSFVPAAADARLCAAASAVLPEVQPLRHGRARCRKRPRPCSSLHVELQRHRLRRFDRKDASRAARWWGHGHVESPSRLEALELEQSSG